MPLKRDIISRNCSLDLPRLFLLHRRKDKKRTNIFFQFSKGNIIFPCRQTNREQSKKKRPKNETSKLENPFVRSGKLSSFIPFSVVRRLRPYFTPFQSHSSMKSCQHLKEGTDK